MGREVTLLPPHLYFLSFLGGQDLREECIKLKKRVFDLERQNQMLSALLQQKLQLTTSSLPQVGRHSSSTRGLRPCREATLGLTDLRVS